MLCFLFLVFLFLYLGVVSFLVILESKILGMVGGSTGPSKISFSSFYFCVLDFVKLLSKFFYLSWSGGSFFLFYLFFLEIFIFVSFLILPFSGFGEVISLGFLLFLVFHSLISFCKILVFGFGLEGFLIVSEWSYGVFVLFVELLFSLGGLFYVVLGILMSGECWLSFGDLLTGLSLGFFPFCYVFFLSLLMKISSTPFDFFESESEFVGGGVLELFGVYFVLWSLIEYSFIFNSVCGSLFLCFGFFVSKWVMGFLVPSVCGMLFVFSGVFISVSFSSFYGMLIELSLVWVFFVLLFVVFLMSIGVFFGF